MAVRRKAATRKRSQAQRSDRSKGKARTSAPGQRQTTKKAAATRPARKKAAAQPGRAARGDRRDQVPPARDRAAAPADVLENTSQAKAVDHANKAAGAVGPYTSEVQTRTGADLHREIIANRRTFTPTRGGENEPATE